MSSERVKEQKDGEKKLWDCKERERQNAAGNWKNANFFHITDFTGIKSSTKKISCGKASLQKNTALNLLNKLPIHEMLCKRDKTYSHRVTRVLQSFFFVLFHLQLRQTEWKKIWKSSKWKMSQIEILTDYLFSRGREKDQGLETSVVLNQFI